jgi:molybdopterin molybdotransferase
MLAGLPVVRERERVHLSVVTGRVLAAPVVSPLDIPSCPTSAMDGYAVYSGDIAAVPATLQIAGTALAGHGYNAPLGPLSCIRIMTGAPLPAGADSIVMQEYAERDGDAVTLSVRPHRESHVRSQGEDIALGEVVFGAGRRLLPSDIARAAMLGISHLDVLRRLRVGFFSTGDELAALSSALKPGEVYDSNRYFLRAALEQLNLVPVDLGLVADDPDSIANALRDARHTADVIITTGGTSVGDKDYMRSVLASNGTVAFSQVAMKPGRPLSFGHFDGIPVILLPGSPMAMMVAFYVVVRDALVAAGGDNTPPKSAIRARLEGTLVATAGRNEYVQATLYRRAGEPVAAPLARRVRERANERQSAHFDGLIELDGSQARIESGAMVDVLVV